MIQRNLIDLPNHPTIPTLTRKAEVIASHNGYAANKIILTVKVYHYDVNGELANYINSEVQLIADNETRIDPQTGEINENPVKDVDTGAYLDTIGEFEYLWSIVNVLKAKTQVELEEIYIQLRINKINKKLYSI